MGDSNSGWGELASDELTEAYDSYEKLPSAGEHPLLDRLCERKNITIESLVRLGARLAEGDVLAFAYPHGLKFRALTDGRRWSFPGSEFPRMKIVRAGIEPTREVIIAEGETDGARLTMLYNIDVAIMPAGARTFPASYAEQLTGYDLVLIGLDNDEAGNDGTALIHEQVMNAVDHRPPEGNDWCEYTGEPPELPDPDETLTREDLILVPAGRMMDLKVPDVASWFEHALLPIGGSLILHGWLKSFKSYLALDLLASLAQGLDWCCFEPTEEPCKVAVIQYEITWPYYRARIEQLRAHARQGGLFDENFMTYSPLRRPELTMGMRKQEDEVLRTLVNGGAQVVLVDPIRRAGGGLDLDKENDARKVLAFFQRMQDNGLTVVTTHHDNKESAKSGGGQPVGMTGSGAWGGDADSIVSVSLPHGEAHQSPRRNLQFTLRNGPGIPGRGMEMDPDGQIIYSPSAWSSETDEGEPAI